MTTGSRTGAVEYRAELRGGPFELVIDHHVLELVVVRHVRNRLRQSPRDGLGVVRAPLAQPLFQGRARGRQDEDAGAVRARAAHLARALPVDLEEHVLAGRELLLNLRRAGAIEIAEHGGVLEECARGDQLLEVRRADEVIVDALGFRRARLARGVRDRDQQIRPRGEQAAHQAGLAGARGGGDDE